MKYRGSDFRSDYNVLRCDSWRPLAWRGAVSTVAAVSAAALSADELSGVAVVSGEASALVASESTVVSGVGVDSVDASASAPEAGAVAASPVSELS